MVKFLLDWSGHHAENQKFIDSILSWAARTPPDNAMSLFLRTDGDQEDKAPPMPTSLLWAVRKSYGAPAQQFVERDTGIDREDLFKRGAIIWSTSQGQKALLELLLGKSTAHGRMALFGLSFGKGKIAQSIDQSNGSLPSVAKHGHMSAVQRLLKKSTDIENKDSFGYTALL